MRNIKHWLLRGTILLASAGATLTIPIGTADAALVKGDLLGVFSGNDSPEALLADLGLDVLRLARVNEPDTMDEGLVLSEIVFNDENEPRSGRWDYFGDDLVDVLVVKADGSYAAYHYTVENTENMRNVGIWDVQDIAGGKHTMSHITVYTMIPEPGTVVLLVIGLVSMGALKRYRR